MEWRPDLSEYIAAGCSERQAIMLAGLAGERKISHNLMMKRLETHQPDHIIAQLMANTNALAIYIDWNAHDLKRMRENQLDEMILNGDPSVISRFNPPFKQFERSYFDTRLRPSFRVRGDDSPPYVRGTYHLPTIE